MLTPSAPSLFFVCEHARCVGNSHFDVNFDLVREASVPRISRRSGVCKEVPILAGIAPLGNQGRHTLGEVASVRSHRPLGCLAGRAIDRSVPDDIEGTGQDACPSRPVVSNMRSLIPVLGDVGKVIAKKGEVDLKQLWRTNAGMRPLINRRLADNGVG